MRADWMDGRLRTNVTAFYSDLEDLQTTAATPEGSFLTTNAGGLEVPGIEAEITASAHRQLADLCRAGLAEAPNIRACPGGCVTPNADASGLRREL